MIARRLRQELQPVPTIADNALADRPLAMAAVAALWCGIGLATAVIVSRRGHDLRYLGPLGIVLGPLLIGFVVASLRHREATARPVVIREAKELGGEERVLVAVIGDPSQIVDVLPLLRVADGHIAQVEVARPVTFDAARAELADEDRIAAAHDLERAALFLDDVSPGLVLLPGRGIEAVARYIDERDADVVMVVGDVEAQAALCRGRERRTVAVMVGRRPTEARLVR